LKRYTRPEIIKNAGEFKSYFPKKTKQKPKTKNQKLKTEN
jgi:hypothetical protein